MKLSENDPAHSAGKLNLGKLNLDVNWVAEKINQPRRRGICTWTLAPMAVV